MEMPRATAIGTPRNIRKKRITKSEVIKSSEVSIIWCHQKAFRTASLKKNKDACRQQVSRYPWESDDFIDRPFAKFQEKSQRVGGHSRTFCRGAGVDTLIITFD